VKVGKVINSSIASKR